MTETEGLRTQPIHNGQKRRFADFAFPKWLEMEFCQFCISEMDGSRDLPILHFQNRWKQRFHFRHRQKQNFHFGLFPSNPFSVFCFLCQALLNVTPDLREARLMRGSVRAPPASEPCTTSSHCTGPYVECRQSLVTQGEGIEI